MDSIHLVKPFEVIHVHSEHPFHLDVSSHFLSNFPLHFKLLDGPDWLKIDEQGLVFGTVPPLKHESQFVITVAAWHSSDLLTATFSIDVIAADMFDSLKKPLLELSMMNKPHFPTEHTLTTREVLTYIFGYYHNKPHGEQFFAKLREKINEFNHHLPEVLTLASVVVVFETLAPEKQQEVLEYAAEPVVLEEAKLRFSEPQMHLSESQQRLTKTASLGFPGHDLQPHEHTLLEHLYAHLETNHPKELQRMIYEKAAAMSLSLRKETKFENFVELIEAAQPKVEKKLEELAVKYPALRKIKMSDLELKESYLVEELGHEKFAVDHVVFCFEEEMQLEDMEELLGLLEKEVVEYRHEHPLDAIKYSHDQFYPHPTPGFPHLQR